MIARYRLLAERIRTELTALEQISHQAHTASDRAQSESDDRKFFVASAAFDLHSFYS